MLVSDLTHQTHTPMWKVKGWGGRATKSSMSTFTGNAYQTGPIAVNSQFNMTSLMLSFPPLIFSRNNVLKVTEHYQYPKQEGDGTNETDVFSREPFIVRFHSPTTCKMKQKKCTLVHTSIPVMIDFDYSLDQTNQTNGQTSGRRLNSSVAQSCLVLDFLK